MYKLSSKVVILGEGRVGKTCLATKFVRNQFYLDEVSTINANYLSKVVNVDKGTVELNIWDTAGQERFRALAPNYYRQATGAIIVYDITDRKSFEKVIAWIKELKEQANKNIIIVVAGNKCDLEYDRQINKTKALEFCRLQKIRHFDTSARNGLGVAEIFNELAQKLLDEYHKRAQAKTTRASRGSTGVSLERSEINPKKKCCE